jgi:hypothetical protein
LNIQAGPRESESENENESGGFEGLSHRVKHHLPVILILKQVRDDFQDLIGDAAKSNETLKQP